LRQCIDASSFIKVHMAYDGAYVATLFGGSSLAGKALGAFSPSSLGDIESVLSRELRSSPSLNAELSARSAFGDSPCSAVDTTGGSRKVCTPTKVQPNVSVSIQRRAPESPGPQSSPAKLRSSSGPQSQSRPFLRKGTRMARSQPPGATKRARAASVVERRSRLEPREAFKQAAALTSSTPSAKRTSKSQQQATASRSVPRDGSTGLETPQRGRARAGCVITPAAVSAPAKQSTLAIRKDCPSFAWRDPTESPDECQDEALPSELFECSPAKRATPERALLPEACVGSSLAKSLEAVMAKTRLSSDQHDASPPPMIRSASRDLGADFEEARSFKVTDDASSGAQLRVLDEQILRFQKDNEALARLRKQAELAEAELVRERELLRSEVEDERKALQAEADREREELRRQRLHLEREAEAKRREAASERLELRERLDELRKELNGKERNWQRSVERLQRQVTDLSQKNRELSESCAKTASNYVAKASQTIDTSEERCQGDYHSEASSVELAAVSMRESPARSPSELSIEHEVLPELTEVPPLPDLAPPVGLSRLVAEPEAEAEVITSSAPSSTLAFQHRRSLPIATSDSAVRARTQSIGAGLRRLRPAVGGVMEKRAVGRCESSAASLATTGTLIREERGTDGRSERFFEDGRREVFFLSGLRKVQWPDGRLCVFFQNGDVKESLSDGTVIYRYHSTGAVQTTHSDGTDIFRFAGGQVEYHRPDGSKEIEFANGARKRISADGFEEVSAADSGGVWTPLEDAMNVWAAGAGA